MGNESRIPFPFAPVMRSLFTALRRRELDPDDALLLAVLCHRADQSTWVASLTLEQLTEACAWSRSGDRLRKRLHRLREQGWVEFTTRRGPGALYAVRLVYDRAEIALNSEPLNHAESGSGDGTGALKLGSSALKSEPVANPVAEPSLAVAEPGRRRIPRDIGEKPTAKPCSDGEGIERLCSPNYDHDVSAETDDERLIALAAENGSRERDDGLREAIERARYAQAHDPKREAARQADLERLDLPDRERDLLADLAETLDGILIDEPAEKRRYVERLHEDAAVFVLDGPPCRYPAHRPSDWINDAGRVVCGTCHPKAA